MYLSWVVCVHSLVRKKMSVLKDILRVFVFREPQASVVKLFCLFLYYLVGVLVYNVVEEGKWNLTQTIYFITVTLTTTGYGYYHPDSDRSKLFTIFYILFGLPIIFSMFNGMMVQILMGAQEGLINSFLRLFGIYDTSKNIMRIYRLNTSLFAIGLMLLIGIIFYASNEQWSYVDATYWVVCTMTTVGYGDLEVQYDSTRVFAIFFIMSCVIIYATATGNILEVYYESINDVVADVEIGATVNNQGTHMTGRFTDTWVEKVLAEQNTTAVERSNFVLMVLEEKGLIDRKRDVRPLLAYFDNMDRMKLGFITKQDLLDFAHDQREQIEEQEGIASNPLHTYYAMPSQQTIETTESDTVSF